MLSIFRIELLEETSVRLRADGATDNELVSTYLSVL